jgi:phosphoglycolate phosphatase-like HAD superfamily hydrolase
MLFCIDSDGCVFDNMRWKHEHAFLPALVSEFQLQDWKDEVAEIWFRINLYSATRGINRFAGFTMCLKELWSSGDTVLRKRIGRDPEGLEAFFANTANCSAAAVQAAIAGGKADPLLPRALTWSRRVNALLDASDVIHAPFTAAVEVLERLSSRGEVTVISQAPHETLVFEWKQANLTRFTTRILGQEFGSKVEQVRSVAGKSVANCLLVGDAPGDAAAARELGCRFHLIRPGDEEAAWRELGNVID